MPLIRAIKSFFDRRLQTAGPQVDRSPDFGTFAAGGWAAAAVWLFVAVITLPVIAWLVVVGLSYEAVARVDGRRRIAEPVRWLIGVVVGAAVAVAIAWWLLGRS